MSQPWDAEISLSPTDARSLIEEQFPNLRVDQVKLLGAGWDTFAFLINDTLVFRFPRRELGARRLESETRVLPQIVPLVPLPIPNPEFVGQSTERFPWMFAGYRYLKGTTACALSLTEDQRTAAAPILGAFLAALHALSTETGLKFGAPEDTLGRLDPIRRVPQAHERVDNLLRQELIADAEPYHTLIEQTGKARPPRATALVHGDLYVRHILLDDAALPCGIIDWGDVHVGDVALDLSIAFSFLPASGRETFRRAYGPIDEPTWQLARFRAISYGLILTEYGRSVDDVNLAREGLWILRLLLED